MNNKAIRDDSILNAFSNKNIFITRGAIDFRIGIDMLADKLTKNALLERMWRLYVDS